MKLREYTELLYEYREKQGFFDTSRACVVFRSVTTVNGVPFDVAKSALQKYIRRGDTRKALNIACEMDLFR